MAKNGKMPAAFAKYMFKPKAKHAGTVNGLMGRSHVGASMRSRMEAQVPFGDSSSSSISSGPNAKTIEVKGHMRAGKRVGRHRRSA